MAIRMKPLAVDLCAGLGGWTDGLLAEGWDVVGFDIERHQYGSHQYPAHLVLQDIRTLDGRQFRGKVSLIVASPPCQKYSYMAMPWTKAKALAKWYRDPKHPERIVELNELFNACRRIAKEAECPIVIENVRGAQPWVGKAAWNYGSFYLWNDVPALMPMTKKYKSHGMNWSDRSKRGQDFTRVAGRQTACVDRAGTKHVSVGEGAKNDGVKTPGRNLNKGSAAKFDTHNMGSGEAIFRELGVKQPGICGVRENGKGDAWFQDGAARHGSKSSARKAASAMIAKIPLTLSRHIARCWYPQDITRPAYQRALAAVAKVE